MKQKADRMQVGATIDKELWMRLRAHAIMKNKTAGQILDEAIRQYLQANEDKDK
jgi:hypothetical protein